MMAIVDKFTGNRFDAYHISDECIVIKTLRMKGTCGCNSVISKTIIPRGTIQYIKSDRHLSYSGLSMAIFLSIVGLSMAFTGDVAERAVAWFGILPVLLCVCWYVYYTYYSAALIIVTNTSSYLSGHNVQDSDEVESWFVQKNNSEMV